VYTASGGITSLGIPLKTETFLDRQILKDSAAWSSLPRKTNVLVECLESLSIN
jgi:hypothetical protein